ncbi:DUF421 domain-containing protein [soil metagenome]
MIHDDFAALGRMALSGLLAYIWLVALLRVSGKRTLAQLNAFDFIVTVALGSILATVVLSDSVAWTEGALALALLALLQLIAAWTSVRWAPARRLLTSQPTLLLHDGQMLDDALRRERISPDSLCAAVRSSGIGGLELVGAVILETNGSLSVISREQSGSGSAIRDVSAASGPDARP